MPHEVFAVNSVEDIKDSETRKGKNLHIKICGVACVAALLGGAFGILKNNRISAGIVPEFEPRSIWGLFISPGMSNAEIFDFFRKKIFSFQLTDENATIMQRGDVWIFALKVRIEGMENSVNIPILNPNQTFGELVFDHDFQMVEVITEDGTKIQKDTKLINVSSTVIFKSCELANVALEEDPELLRLRDEEQNFLNLSDIVGSIEQALNKVNEVTEKNSQLATILQESLEFLADLGMDFGDPVGTCRDVSYLFDVVGLPQNLEELVQCRASSNYLNAEQLLSDLSAWLIHFIRVMQKDVDTWRRECSCCLRDATKRNERKRLVDDSVKKTGNALVGNINKANKRIFFTHLSSSNSLRYAYGCVVLLLEEALDHLLIPRKHHLVFTEKGVCVRSNPTDIAQGSPPGSPSGAEPICSSRALAASWAMTLLAAGRQTGDLIKLRDGTKLFIGGPEIDVEAKKFLLQAKHGFQPEALSRPTETDAIHTGAEVPPPSSLAEQASAPTGTKRLSNPDDVGVRMHPRGKQGGIAKAGVPSRSVQAVGQKQNAQSKSQSPSPPPPEPSPPPMTDDIFGDTPIFGAPPQQRNLSFSGEGCGRGRGIVRGAGAGRSGGRARGGDRGRGRPQLRPPG
jgi:hypothetical protein